MTYQIMYSSQAAEPMTAAALEKILTDARAGNAARNVTGALIYVDGVFFQILEGDKAVVHELMANIARDSRHQSVTVFHEAEVEARAFESWRMAYLSPTPEQMSQVQLEPCRKPWAGALGGGDEQVDVAGFSRFAARERTEHTNIARAMPFGDGENGVTVRCEECVHGHVCDRHSDRRHYRIRASRAGADLGL